VVFKFFLGKARSIKPQEEILNRCKRRFQVWQCSRPFGYCEAKGYNL